MEEQNPETKLHQPSEERPPWNEEKNKQIATETDDDQCEIQTILDRFTKNRLIRILKVAADEDTKIRGMIEREADSTSLHRQIFACSYDPFNAETLFDYFNQFGEVLDCKTSQDCDSGLYYGFILFKNRIGAWKALQDNRTKCIGGTHVYCDFPEKDNFPDLAKRRVYVHGIKEEMDVGELRELFSGFGEIEEGPLGVDKITGKIKGHCYFVYKTKKSAKEAIQEPQKLFRRHILYCLLDEDPELKNLPDPSRPSSSTVPQGAKGHNAGRGTNASPGRAQDDAGADQNPIPTSPCRQGSSAPTIPEPKNPPNPGISATNSFGVLQGPTGYIPVLLYALPGIVGVGADQNASFNFTYPRHQGSSNPSNTEWPGTIHGYPVADQNPFFTHPYHQGSPNSWDHGHPYDQESAFERPQHMPSGGSNRGQPGRSNRGGHSRNQGQPGRGNRGGRGGNQEQPGRGNRGGRGGNQEQRGRGNRRGRSVNQEQPGCDNRGGHSSHQHNGGR